MNKKISISTTPFTVHGYCRILMNDWFWGFTQELTDEKKASKAPVYIHIKADNQLKVNYRYSNEFQSEKIDKNNKDFCFSQNQEKYSPNYQSLIINARQYADHLKKYSSSLSKIEEPNMKITHIVAEKKKFIMSDDEYNHFVDNIELANERYAKEIKYIPASHAFDITFDNDSHCIIDIKNIPYFNDFSDDDLTHVYISHEGSVLSNDKHDLDLLIENLCQK